MKQINILLAIILSLTFIQCKNNSKSKDVSTSDISLTELPEDFVIFFKKFHSDSIFQMKHITFPLEGMTNALDSKPDSLIHYKWHKDKWKLHRKFDNYDNIFTRKFYLFDENTVIEKISGVDGLFQMERRFSKLNDGWNLIYYSLK